MERNKRQGTYEIFDDKLLRIPIVGDPEVFYEKWCIIDDHWAFRLRSTPINICSLSVAEMSIYWAFRLRSTPSNNTRSLGVSTSLNAQSSIRSLSVVEMSV